MWTLWGIANILNRENVFHVFIIFTKWHSSWEMETVIND